MKKVGKTFTITSNQLAQDERLTWKARGIFLYLASMPDDWRFYVKEVAKHSPQGKEALQSGLEELEKFGYLQRIQKHDNNGKFGSFDWLLNFEPINRQRETPANGETRQRENPPLQNKHSNKKTPAQNKHNKDNVELPPDHASSELIESVVEYLNQQTGAHYRATTAKTKALINARVKEKATLDDFKTVIDVKVSQWKDDAKMSKYLRPETLFGPKFEGYLNERPVKKETVNNPLGW